MNNCDAADTKITIKKSDNRNLKTHTLKIYEMTHRFIKNNEI